MAEPPHSKLKQAIVEHNSCRVHNVMSIIQYMVESLPVAHTQHTSKQRRTCTYCLGMCSLWNIFCVISDTSVLCDIRLLTQQYSYLPE